MRNFNFLTSDTVFLMSKCKKPATLHQYTVLQLHNTLPILQYSLGRKLVTHFQNQLQSIISCLFSQYSTSQHISYLVPPLSSPLLPFPSHFFKFKFHFIVIQSGPFSSGLFPFTTPTSSLIITQHPRPLQLFNF